MEANELNTNKIEIKEVKSVREDLINALYCSPIILKEEELMFLIKLMDSWIEINDGGLE